MEEKLKAVIGGKVDLDTVGVGFFWAIGRDNYDVSIVRSGQASEEDLAADDVICIEVGGSGRVGEMNFDHHDPSGPTESATAQAFRASLRGALLEVEEWFGGNVVIVAKLVSYIDILDTRGAKSLPSYGQIEFPTLSDVFAGMLLTTRDPVEQFYRGVELLDEIVQTGQDPFGTIRGFDSYAEAKAENNRQVAEAGRKAEWSVTRSGRKLGYLETDFYGAPGVLYGLGAEVVVAYAPRFGNPPVPKFTVAGNDVRVDSALQRLNELEPGWGGPATRTIIGSPREGSRLSLEDVVEVVKAAL